MSIKDFQNGFSSGMASNGTITEIIENKIYLSGYFRASTTVSGYSASYFGDFYTLEIPPSDNNCVRFDIEITDGYSWIKNGVNIRVESFNGETSLGSTTVVSNGSTMTYTLPLQEVSLNLTADTTMIRAYAYVISNSADRPTRLRCKITNFRVETIE